MSSDYRVEHVLAALLIVRACEPRALVWVSEDIGDAVMYRSTVLSRTTYFAIRSTFSHEANHQHRPTPLISEDPVFRVLTGYDLLVRVSNCEL